MPIYEYQCPHCQHTFDAMQKMSEAPLTECPQCKQSNVVRLVSAAGFQLKGSGWYVTDFKNKGQPPETKPATQTPSTATKAETPAKGENS